jgi:hypothetical protein
MVLPSGAGDVQPEMITFLLTMRSERPKSGRAALALTVGLAAMASGCGDDFTPEEQLPAPPCHPAELEDDFAGDQLSLLWNTHGQTGTVGVAEGRGFIELGPNQAPHNVGMTTERAYDLRGCNLWVEVARVPPAEVQGGALLMAGLDGDNAAIIETWAGMLAMGMVINGTYQAGTSTTYDAARHRWWRLREEDGTIHFETSADAQKWDTLLQSASPVSVDGVTVALAAQVAEPYGDVLRVEFDNLNLLP